MKAPSFWTEGGLLSDLLAPVGWLWAVGSAWRAKRGVNPYRAPIPVICIGNLVAGGAGKTPVALSLAEMIPGAHFLSQGYGGSEQGPLRVDPQTHTHRQVGDEPLLLGEVAPCWVSKNRAKGAKAAAAAGAKVLIMDDGFQNPSLVKDLSIIVVDGHVGFGTGRCIPAGPLREPISWGLARAGAVVIVGEDKKNVAKLARQHKVPVLRAHLEHEAEASSLAGQPVVAFAGIGRPNKFFTSLDRLGANIVEAYAFPDHHPYHPNEISELVGRATMHEAALITTAKDMVRIPPHLRGEIGVLNVIVAWEDEDAVLKVLSNVVKVGGA